MSTHTADQPYKRFNNSDVSRVFGEDYTFEIPTTTLAPVKRVALFAETFFPHFDGASQTAYNTLRYLQQTGREVLVFAPDDAPDHIGASKVIRIPSFSAPKYRELRVGLPVAQIARQLGQFQPDLIHLSAPISMSTPAISFGRQKKIPLVAVYTTNLPQCMGYYGVGYLQGVMARWLRYLHNRCNLTLVPSKPTQDQLTQNGYTHLACWQHGVNEKRFNPANRSEVWRARLLNGRDPSSLLCIYVGRLASEKSVEVLHEIAAMPGVALTIVGDGPLRHQLETVFKDTNAYFTGCLFGTDLACAYASADVFVFPSQTETFGLVTI